MNIYNANKQLELHEKAIEILGAIKAMEQRVRCNDNFLASPMAGWLFNLKAKAEHQKEIQLLAIERLWSYYSKHIDKLTINPRL